MNILGIYAFVNLLDGRRYIGQSCNIYKRKNDHLSLLRRGKHSNRRFQRAFNRDGEESFCFVILCECSQENLNSAEQYFLGDLSGLYNTSPEAQANGAGKRDAQAILNIKEGVRLARIKDPTISDRQKQTLKQTIANDASLRAKFGAANVGRIHSDEERQKRARSVKAAKSTDEHRRLVSENSKRIWQDDEFRKKHRAAMEKVLTPEYRASLSEAIKKGKAAKFADPEYRAAISEKLKAAWAIRKQRKKEQQA